MLKLENMRLVNDCATACQALEFSAQMLEHPDIAKMNFPVPSTNLAAALRQISKDLIVLRQNIDAERRLQKTAVYPSLTD